MRIIHGKTKRKLDNDHPATHAILAILAMVDRYEDNGRTVPQRGDTARLWRDLRKPHKALLVAVSEHAQGVTQSELVERLRADLRKPKFSVLSLRGIHIGLARICDGLGIEKPIETIGYNAENRTYRMRPDAAGTVRKLAKRDSE
jgi:hypothetical protein